MRHHHPDPSSQLLFIKTKGFGTVASEIQIRVQLHLIDLLPDSRMGQAQIDRLESTIWVDVSITSKIQVVEAHPLRWITRRSRLSSTASANRLKIVELKGNLLCPEVRDQSLPTLIIDHIERPPEN